MRIAKQLIAHVGLDSEIRQSGHSLNSTGKLMKRRSSYLQRSLFIAASIARRYDPHFNALYEKNGPRVKLTQLQFVW